MPIRTSGRVQLRELIPVALKMKGVGKSTLTLEIKIGDAQETPTIMATLPLQKVRLGDLNLLMFRKNLANGSRKDLLLVMTLVRLMYCTESGNKPASGCKVN